MQQLVTRIEISTRGPGLYEFTDGLEGFVRTSGVVTGLLTAFCRHTSASLLIQENADPSARRDLEVLISATGATAPEIAHAVSRR